MAADWVRAMPASLRGLFRSVCSSCIRNQTLSADVSETIAAGSTIDSSAVHILDV